MLLDGITRDVATGRPADRAEKLLALAYLSYKSGDNLASRTSCLDALHSGFDWWRSARAGTLLARMGYLDDAERVLQGLGSDTFPPVSEIVRHMLVGEIKLAQHTTTAALTEFAQVDTLQAAGEDREYLAHALAVTGKSADAFSIYRKICDTPGKIWQQPQIFPPGYLADNLYQCGTLGLKVDKTRGESILERYRRLRQNGDSGIPKA
jgi:hypothetical protein